MNSTHDAPNQGVPTPVSPPLPPVPGGTAANAERRDPYEKLPPLAAFLSVLPGLGHLYVGAYQRAIMVVGCFFLAIFLLPAPVSIFLPIFIWFFGIFDAYRQAQLANLGDHPAPQLANPSQSNLAFGVFLTVAGVLLLLYNFDLMDFEWLQDWWPAILILVGVAIIAGGVRERMQKDPADNEGDTPDTF